VKTKPEEDIKLPSDIKGLDIKSGIRRMLGKKSLYHVHAAQVSLPGRIRHLPKSSSHRKYEWDVAERLAHTLKGVSGNISAIALTATVWKS